MTPSEQLADIAAQLATIELTPATPNRDVLVTVLAGRTFTLPRGTVLALADGPGVLYIENSYGRDWDNGGGDRRYSTTVTVYGTVTRGDKESRGSVEVRRHEDDCRGTVRAYWRNLTGASVPDGARALIAERVLSIVRHVIADDNVTRWTALADETARAKRAADIGRHISDAIRATDDARRAMGETVNYR